MNYRRYHHKKDNNVSAYDQTVFDLPVETKNAISDDHGLLDI